MAPVHLALAAHRWAEPTLITTGQHGAAVREALEPFDLEPDVSLTIERSTADLVDLCTDVQRALSVQLAADRFDAVVVQGDTASTLSGALVSYWRRMPLVHLEAGLRTGDLYAPFPEEGNRRLVSALAALHLAPTMEAASNLHREGIDPSTVRVIGNTSVDAVVHTAARSQAYPSRVPEGFDGHVIVTAHRRESWGQGIRAISSAVSRLAVANPRCAFLVSTHMNPAVQRDVREVLVAAPNVSVWPALPYGEFARALAGARLVLTDSGGVQEEGSALGVPVLVLRDVTERPEVVAAGGAIVVGTDADRIVAFAQELLNDPEGRAKMAAAACPFGDGKAAERAAEAILELLGCGRIE